MHSHGLRTARDYFAGTARRAVAWMLPWLGTLGEGRGEVMLVTDCAGSEVCREGERRATNQGTSGPLVPLPVRRD